MLAIEASLENGQLVLHEPLPLNTTRARVFILVENQAPVSAFPAGALHHRPSSPEAEFDALALASWMDDQVDERVDWEAHFGLKPELKP